MNKRFVLLVEDNENDEALTRRAFKQNKMADRLVVTRDGAEALDFLLGGGVHAGRDLDQMPSLILLDLNLPKMDGLEVLRHLSAYERTKLIPVVILTSSDEEKDIRSSYQLGVNSYIRKPVDYDEFVETVRQLGLYWLKLNDTIDK